MIPPLLYCLSLECRFFKLPGNHFIQTFTYIPASGGGGAPVLPNLLAVATDNLQMHNCGMDVIQLLPKIANISLEATVITLGCTRRALGTLSWINWLTILTLPFFLTHPLNYIEFVMTISLSFPNCIINPENMPSLELACPSYNLIWPEAWLQFVCRLTCSCVG